MSTTGIKKRIAPATQAHYRLRSTKLRKEKGPNLPNGVADAIMREASEAHETPTVPPLDPAHQPVQIGPETPQQAQHFPSLAPENQYTGPLPAQDTPPASPTHDPPQSQLSLELHNHITAAVTSRTAQIKSTGDEVLELVTGISQKIAIWEEKSLEGAASLGRDIRTLVLNFSKSLADGHPAEEREQQPHPPKNSTYAETTRASPSSPKANLKPIKKLQPQPEKTPRIFLHLPKDHAARQASPYATMDILRKHLDETCSAAVKEIQQVPSGLAIWPKDGLGLQLLTEHKELLECLIQGVTVSSNMSILVDYLTKF